MTTELKALRDWVAEAAELTQADRVHWCTGTESECYAMLHVIAPATFSALLPHRSDPSVVARVEHLTFVCTTDKDDAGPNNNWMAPARGEKMMRLLRGAMRGRTMYVIPYCMGPIDSPYSRCGVEITDSPYVVVNMYLMTRMGNAALQRIERDGTS
jgi:phosphoenolpyruvate carboxykinase (GTP)